MNIAVILTCFNRREKTVRSLTRLFEARDEYNARVEEKINLTVYLTDDGCTDGTADAVRQAIGNDSLHVVEGDGRLYWAGGMRKAWKVAMTSGMSWDFYLLVNDDTDVKNNVFDEFLKSHTYCLKTSGQPGIYSGATHASDDSSKITYGGALMTNRILGRVVKVKPNGQPRLVDMTNANILFVPREVVESIGIFYEGFRHGNADYDYTIQAREHGFGVYLSSEACGVCDFDHGKLGDSERKLMTMPLSERRKYLSHPLHSDKDYLIFIRRSMPAKYPVCWVLRKVRLYFPTLYYTINRARSVY